MSYTSLSTQTRDAHLRDRIHAASQQQARNNPALVDTDAAALVRQGDSLTHEGFVWSVSVDTEAQYESALANDNPDPGGDPAVISDAMILSAVQAHWPPDAP